eukprot:500605-Pelagomonas_calceolata.AAC.4
MDCSAYSERMWAQGGLVPASSECAHTPRASQGGVPCCHARSVAKHSRKVRFSHVALPAQGALPAVLLGFVAVLKCSGT